MKTINKVRTFEERIKELEYTQSYIREVSLLPYAEQKKLFEKCRYILEADAKRYAKKSRGGYNYWYNEGHLILLEAYRKNPSITLREVIKTLNIGLRDTFRKENKSKQREILYGLAKALDYDFDSGKPSTPQQKAHYKKAIEKANEEEISSYLSNVLNKLEKREREILILYFFGGYEEREIANYYNISQQMVGKIKNRALNKLKYFLFRGCKIASGLPIYNRRVNHLVKFGIS